MDITIGGVSFISQHPNQLLDKSIKDLVATMSEMDGELAIGSATVDLFNMITNDKVVLPTDSALETNFNFLNPGLGVVNYVKPDVNNKINRNVAVGSIISPTGSLTGGAYSYNRTAFVGVSQPTPADVAQYQNALADPSVGLMQYAAKLFNRGRVSLSRSELIMALRSFFSDGVDNISVTAGGRPIYIQQVGTEILNLSLSSADPYNVSSMTKTQIVMADNTVALTQTPATAEGLTNAKIEKIVENLEHTIKQSEGRLYIMLPSTLMRIRRRSWESNSINSYSNTGYKQEFERLIKNANSILGRGTMVVDPIFNFDMNSDVEVVYVSIPDDVWVEAYGAKTITKSLRNGTLNVYNIFAFTGDTMRHEYSNLLVESIPVPKGSAQGVNYGIGEFLQIKQKFSAVIANPYTINLVEIPSDGIVLRSEIPNVTFNNI